MIPVRRQSIHADKKFHEQPKRIEVLSQCNFCLEYYQYDANEEEKQIKLSEEKAKKWQEINHTKPELYPDLREAPFTCKNCEKKESISRVAQSGTTIGTNETETKIGLPMKTTGIKFPLIVLVVAMLTIGAGFYLRGYTHNNETPFAVNVYNSTDSEEIFDEELYNLTEKYKHQEEKVWYTLSAGIKSVIKVEPNQPSVFLFLFDNEEAGSTAECLAKDVSKPTTKHLMKRTIEPMTLSGADLKKTRFLKDPGQLLVDYNSTVREKGTWIVKNLQDVPPTVATSFHFFCDKYSPLVERAVYFFTLKIDRWTEEKLQKIAENRLRELWSELKDNILQPLITRMTPNVLKIESDVSNC